MVPSVDDYTRRRVEQTLELLRGVVPSLRELGVSELWLGDTRIVVGPSPSTATLEPAPGPASPDEVRRQREAIMYGAAKGGGRK